MQSRTTDRGESDEGDDFIADDFTGNKWIAVSKPTENPKPLNPMTISKFKSISKSLGLT